MAESGESAPKTSELYLGIVDLFAVILPGAIIAFLAQISLDLKSHSEWLTGARGWTAFLAASYIIGHVISAVGGLLFDKIYDTGFKLRKAHSSYFGIRLRARDVMQSVLKSYYSDKDNAMEWAGIITRLRSAAASAEIDRLEADSKFFRSLTTVLILGWPIWILIIRNSHFPLVQPRELGMRVFALILAVLSLLPLLGLRYYVERRESLHKQQKAPITTSSDKPLASLEIRVLESLENAQPLAIPCWRATLWAATVWILLVTGSGALLMSALTLVAAGWGVLAVFSGWRYMELRLKRTRLTYAYAIALSLQASDSSASRAA